MGNDEWRYDVEAVVELLETLLASTAEDTAIILYREQGERLVRMLRHALDVGPQ